MQLDVFQSIGSHVCRQDHTNFVRSVLQLQCVPLYGSYAVYGKRPATEDATANVPIVAQFMKIPTQMSVAYHYKACEPEFIWSI